MSPYRVAVVGLGWAGRSIWLPRLHRHPAFEVVAAVDSDPAVRGAVAAEFPGLAAHTAGVDLAVVAVPNHLHHDVARSLLRTGVPVFVEKPVCLSVAEADSLATTERAGGAVLLAGSAARYRADVVALHQLCAKVDRIRHIELSWVRARGIPSGAGWFTRRRLAGGGALVDLGWHLLDVAGPLLGDADIDQVVGSVSADFVRDATRGAAWRQDAASTVDGDVEDTAHAFLVNGSGVSVALRASWASHEERDVTAVTVYGSAGTARLRCTFGFSPNRERRSVLTLTQDGVTDHHEVPDEPVGAEYDRQLDQIPGLLTDPASRGRAIQEARRTVGVIEGVYRSARSRTARRRTA